jgi:hypothetical protein
MYRFFNGEDPETDEVADATGDEVEITGKVSYFPQNAGALGTLEIREVDPDTGYRLSDETVGEWTVDESGEWGPQTLKKGASYEYAFEHASGARHYFYREPFFSNDYFVRLLTSTEDGIGTLMTQTPDHVDIVVQRDKEFWGDQDAGNDELVVDGTSVATELAAARDKRLSGLFLLDWGPGAHPSLPDGVEIDFTGYELGASNLDEPIAIFHGIGFISGIDLFMPAASPPDRTIELRLTPRGGGADQVVNIPNWASDEVRVSVGFRDYTR